MQTQFYMSIIALWWQSKRFQTSQSWQSFNLSLFRSSHMVMNLPLMTERVLSQSASGRDLCPLCDTLRQSSQLWVSQSSEYRTTSPANREIPATMVRPRVQNVPWKTGEPRPASYTHGKAAQDSSNNQGRDYISDLAWPCLDTESAQPSEILLNVCRCYWLIVAPATLPTGPGQFFKKWNECFFLNTCVGLLEHQVKLWRLSQTALAGWSFQPLEAGLKSINNLR